MKKVTGWLLIIVSILITYNAVSEFIDIPIARQLPLLIIPLLVSITLLIGGVQLLDSEKKK